MKYKITNVKVSIKIQEVCLDTVVQKLEKKEIKYTRYQNYIVIQDIFTYIIFKPSCKQKNYISHVNITKIPLVCNIEEAKTHLIFLIDCDILTNFAVIDNITVSLSIKHNLTPEVISRIFKDICKVTFNKETFPGIFLKFDCGTAIIFHTGKCILIGCKNIFDVDILSTYITEKLDICNERFVFTPKQSN